MRYPVLLLALLTLACAGADTGTVNPPPPPPGPPPPPPGGTIAAVLAIQSGDGQQAEPGATLSVKPLVAVKDSAGRGVAGVTVTFAIDSGGGLLQSPTAITTADGTAGPGDWHLGASEGRNVMSATAGSLPRVKFVATALVGTVTLTTQPVGSGGKTITISTGALAGTSLVIPAGAFTQNATWTLEQRSSADWPRRTGINPVGAVLHITSGDTGRAAQVMMLTLPAVVPAGTKPFVLMRDRATNNVEVLQTVTVDPGTITVAVMHFDASWIPQSPAVGAGVHASSRSGAGAATGYDAEVVVSAIPPEDWNKDVDTGFRPGVDDWDFAPLPTSFAYGPQDINRAGIESGRVLTQMADFAYLKTPTRGPLFKKYREIPGDARTTRVGYRAASVAGYITDGSNGFLTVIHNSARAGQADQQFFDVLKANLLVSRMPQLVYAVGTEWYPFTAYAITGSSIAMVSPFTPGLGTSLQFAGGRFAAFNSIDENGVSHLVEWIGVAGLGQSTKMSLIAQHVVDASNGIDNYSDHWPPATVHARGGFVEDTIMYAVDDTTRFWVECATCKTGLASSLPPGRVEPFLAYVPDQGFSYENGGGNTGVLLNPVNANDTRLGFMVLESDGNLESWLDFQWIRLKKWVMTLPAGLTAEPGVATTFTLAIDGPTLIPPHQFVWTFGTGVNAVTVASVGPTVTTTLSQVGTLPVTIEMRRTNDDKVIAVSHGTVKVDTPIYTAWKVTSMTTTIVNDTRGVDTRTAQQGNLWLNLVLAHDPVSQYGFLWSTYQADSTFLYTAQSTNAAITLIARDTLFGPPSAPTTGYHRSIYWWNYGSYPTSAATPVTAALKGSNNTLTRGGTSCRPAYSARFTQTGTLSAGQVTGLDWYVSETTSGVREPTVMFEYNITFNGDVATGTVTKTYRIYPDCNGNPEVTWSYQTTLTAQRIR